MESRKSVPTSAKAKHQFKIKKCDYTCEKEITLNKHTNTQHDELQENIQQVKESGTDSNKDSKVSMLYCDECNYSAKNKKGSKKH